MNGPSRRSFLEDVGRGMLIAGIGPAVAADLGLATASTAGDTPDRLTFGAIEPLVALMQETPVDRLLPLVIDRMKAGTPLPRMVAAAALANARAFGGQDYEGYHALMALLPSYQIAMELPEDARPLPVLKVLYRNTSHIQDMGGRSHETLHPIDGAAAKPDADALREAARRQDMDAAERTFDAIARGPLDQAYNDLQAIVHDSTNVHRVVLAWRAWALLDLTGKEHARTLLRQSVRFCVDEEASVRKYKSADTLRALLPRLFDQYRLAERSPGDRRPDDAWVETMAATIYGPDRSKAAEAVAAALADGVSPESVGEAMSVAANRLVLHDPGRRQDDTKAKPKGSVHGASVGVHASDAANAWRNIARVTNPRNAFASLVVGAFHTAGQSGSLNANPYPMAEHLDKVRDVAPAAILPEAESAIRANDQPRATALIHRYGSLGLPEAAAFDLLRKFAISEDGALHAEKYYRTVTEEFATTRPAFRWRQLAGLARVTASEFGHPAPGIDEARRILGVGISGSR